jgi:hypothetical protein
LTALQKGIGVSTTRARLQHQFGADFRFEFHRLEKGVAVVVAVPWRAEAQASTPQLDEGDLSSPSPREQDDHTVISTMGATGARA